MQTWHPWIIVATLSAVLCWGHFDAAVTAEPSAELSSGQASISQAWQGDYPVAQLYRLPPNQRQRAVGFIADAKTFADVWAAFKPGETVPEIDFSTQLVLFVRNTDFYNRISIAGVNVDGGVAEVLAMQTLSALPIEDKVAMSMAVVDRTGISAIQTADGTIPVPE